MALIFGADANTPSPPPPLFLLYFRYVHVVRPSPAVLPSGERRQQHEQRLPSLPERPLLYFQRAHRLHPRFDARARIGRPAALRPRG